MKDVITKSIFLTCFLFLPCSASAQVPDGGFKVCVNHVTGNMRVRARCLNGEREMSTRVMKDLATEKKGNQQPQLIFQHPGVVVEDVRSLSNGSWRVDFRTPDAPQKKRRMEISGQMTKGSVDGYEYFIRW